MPPVKFQNVPEVIIGGDAPRYAVMANPHRDQETLYGITGTNRIKRETRSPSAYDSGSLSDARAPPAPRGWKVVTKEEKVEDRIVGSDIALMKQLAAEMLQCDVDDKIEISHKRKTINFDELIEAIEDTKQTNAENLIIIEKHTVLAMIDREARLYAEKKKAKDEILILSRELDRLRSERQTWSF